MLSPKAEYEVQGRDLGKHFLSSAMSPSLDFSFSFFFFLYVFHLQQCSSEAWNVSWCYKDEDDKRDVSREAGKQKGLSARDSDWQGYTGFSTTVQERVLICINIYHSLKCKVCHSLIQKEECISASIPHWTETALQPTQLTDTFGLGTRIWWHYRQWRN